MAPARKVAPSAELAVRFADIREYEAAQLVAGLVGGAQLVLNVGPSWGRDYWQLAFLGKRVVNLDIGHTGVPDLILVDVTRPWPLREGAFDVVILAEVLEHLFSDLFALQEARRVLADSGHLVVTVPFHNDDAEYHVRIHSEKTVRRLLQAGGFRVERCILRGGLISFPQAVHALRRLLAPVVGAAAVNGLVLRLDLLLGTRMPWALRHSRYAGCYLVASKDEPRDFLSLNAREFGR